MTVSKIGPTVAAMLTLFSVSAHANPYDADGNRNQAAQQAIAQFDQMRDKGLFLRGIAHVALLFVVSSARD